MATMGPGLRREEELLLCPSRIPCVMSFTIQCTRFPLSSLGRNTGSRHSGAQARPGPADHPGMTAAWRLPPLAPGRGLARERALVLQHHEKRITSAAFSATM